VDWEREMGFILEHICGLIKIYNYCSVKEERPWDLFYDIMFLDPVTTHHISQFQLLWPHRRSRCSPVGDEIIDEDDVDENWADPGVPSTWRSRPGDDTDNDDGEGEEDNLGRENRNGNGKGTKGRKGKGKAPEDRKGKGKEKGQGNGKGKCIFKQALGGNDISPAVDLLLQMEMYEPDSDTEG